MESAVKKRLAIIGFGKIARDSHVPAIKDNPNFELVAIVSLENNDIGLPNFDSLEKLHQSGLEIDAVCICTPPQVRAKICEKAIELGYDLLLEKPPTANTNEFARIAAHAAQKGVILYTAWHSRFAANVAAAKALISNKNLCQIKMIWRESALKWHPGQDWLWREGGLGVFDPAINGFSILTEILGTQIIVDSANFEIPENCQMPIAANLEMRAGEVSIHADLDFREETSEIWTIEFHAQNSEIILLKDGGQTLAFNGQSQTGENQEYKNLYQDFYNHLKANKSLADNGPQGIVEDAFSCAIRTPCAPFYP